MKTETQETIYHDGQIVISGRNYAEELHETAETLYETLEEMKRIIGLFAYRSIDVATAASTSDRWMRALSCIRDCIEIQEEIQTFYEIADTVTKNLNPQITNRPNHEML